MAEQQVDGSILEEITRKELNDDFEVPTFGEAKRILKLIQDARQAGVDNRLGQQDASAPAAKRFRGGENSMGVPSASQSRTSISSSRGHTRGQAVVCKASPAKGRGKAASSGKMSSPGKSSARPGALGTLMSQGDIDFA